MFKLTDKIAIFGRTGSGKSTLCRTIQGAFPRVIIFDILREYSDQDCDYLVDNLADFGHTLISLKDDKTPSFRVIYQFDIENAGAMDQDFNKALRMIYHFGNVACVIEEIHLYCEREHMPEWLKNLILVGRHHGIGLIMTSQRPAEVPKTFVSQCHHVFCGVLFEKNDLKYFHDTIGSDAERLPTIPAFHFLHYRPGAPSRIVRND